MNTENPDSQQMVPSTNRLEQLSKFRRWNTSWLGRIDSYLIHLIAIFSGGIFMRFFQRMTIHHRSRLKQLKLPSMILPNHVSILDDFFLGPPILFPMSIFRYDLMPYHAPEEKNFFKGKFLSYMMRKLKCVPLTRGAGFKQPGMLRLIELIQDNNVLWMYPEGGRTRSGDINSGKAGVGMILYRSRAQAIPIYHEGLHRVLPIGKSFPRLFRRVDVIIGEPVPLDDLFALPDEPRTWQAIADRVIESLKALRDELHTIVDQEGNAKPVKKVMNNVDNAPRLSVSRMKAAWRDVRWQPTLANYLTLFRLFLVPVFVLLFLSDHFALQIVATVVFIVAAITDAVDGYIARKRNEVTSFGEFIDPFADKLLTLTAFVLIALRKEFSLILINLLVYISLIATREIGITMLRIWAIDRGQPLITSVWGKMKTGIQLTTLIGTLVYFNIRDLLREFGLKVAYFDDKTMVPVLHGLFILCVIITVISGYLYIRNLIVRHRNK